LIGRSGIGLALEVAIMAKAGLAALADGYGLERTESDRFKQLGERFFELLGDGLAPLAGPRVKLIGGCGLALESFAEFCAASPAQHTLIVEVAGRTVLTFRIDHQLVVALVDGVLGRDDAAERGTSANEAPVLLTPTELRIVTNILKDALPAVTRRVFDELFDGFFGATAEPATFRAREATGPALLTIEPTEMMVAATGQYSMNGRTGPVAVGLTLASVVARRTHSAPASGALVADHGEQRARATLGGARIPLAAVLGSVKLPLATVKALACGSIIPLGRLRGRAPTVELRTGGQTLWAGTVIAERGWYRFLIRHGEEAVERSDSI
jgi:flagellar motor switch protein FliM